MNVSAALTSRISINNFDATATISEAEITELVRLAQEAPSSFNIQFTRFVAVTDPAMKAALRGHAFGQPKITEASVVMVLVGDLKAHESYAVRMRAAAAAGFLPADLAERLVGMATGFYSNLVMAREEAARSAGLSAMALMLAAEERGWVSCPMIGFDAKAFAEVLGLDENHSPMMVVVIGKAAAGNMPRKQRLTPNEVLRFNQGKF